MEGYLIFDIGTGNARVALVAASGAILGVERCSVRYVSESDNAEALSFDPKALWNEILALADTLRAAHPDVSVLGISASSQREGVVLIDEQGQATVGFPNHDFRGRFLEADLPDKDEVYRLTGRYPSALFSAFKLAAYRDKHPQEWASVRKFLSIGDWAQYELTGVMAYEHAHASETQVYDVQNKAWSARLFGLFDLDESLAPPLVFSGEKLGAVQSDLATRWSLSPETPVFMGGADTQLAVKSTRPETSDIVLVSGTTTPIVQVTDSYVLDDKQRSWTNSHLHRDEYILETNCGVTGLNYQHVKAIFYPNESYEVVEREMATLENPACVANLGSLIAGSPKTITRGGFHFTVPVMKELSRADFAFATLWDIACAIKENFDTLLDIQPYAKDYVWCCGGGFQSTILRKFVAGLIGKTLRIRPGYQQASVSGAAVVCGDALGKLSDLTDQVTLIEPVADERYDRWYRDWKELRESL